MTDLLQAAKQALEALKNYHNSDDDRLSVAMDILAMAFYTAPPQRECDEINYEDWEFNPMTGESLWGKEPPQREWVEPSDEQIDRIWLKMPEKDEFEDVHWFARAVLKLAKELNNANNNS